MDQWDLISRVGRAVGKGNRVAFEIDRSSNGTFGWYDDLHCNVRHRAIGMTERANWHKASITNRLGHVAGVKAGDVQFAFVHSLDLFLCRLKNYQINRLAGLFLEEVHKFLPVLTLRVGV